MTRLLTAFTEPAYALLRIVAGLLFSCHGMQKILGWFADPQNPMKDLQPQMILGGYIELICGLLIAIGLFTRSAAFLASGTMAVAYVQFHWMHEGHLRFDSNFFPIVNHGELAVLNAFVFLFIACKGAGIFSVHRARAGSERT
jgi:putative oxidoreductase